jgi:hypothetical protein
MMMVIVEKFVDCEVAEETEVLADTMSQCHFVHHKSRMTWPGLEPGQPRQKASD